jgi:hypothetical protein
MDRMGPLLIGSVRLSLVSLAFLERKYHLQAPVRRFKDIGSRRAVQIGGLDYLDE